MYDLTFKQGPAPIIEFTWLSEEEAIRNILKVLKNANDSTFTVEVKKHEE